MQNTIFAKATTDKVFYFVDFSIEKIENKEFIKINVLDKCSTTAFSIYKENNNTLYNIIKEIKTFDNIDSKIFVVYKNGRLKFDFKTN